MRSQPSWNVAAVASRVAVVAGRHRGAAELELADLALAAAASPDSGSTMRSSKPAERAAEHRQPARRLGAASGRRRGVAARVSSTRAVDGVDVPCPAPSVGERDRELASAMPNAGNTGPAVEAVAARPRRRTPRPRRVDRLGAVEREPPAGDRSSAARRAAAPGAPARTRSSGPAVIVPRYSEIHSIQHAGAGEEVLRRAEHELEARAASAS